MTGLPKHDSADFFDELSALSLSEASNRFALNQFEQRAKSFLGYDACLGYQALGALAAIRGDLQSMRANHLRAIRLRPNDMQTYSNYSTSLARTGYFNDSFELLQQRYDMFRSSPDLLKRYVRALVQCGRLDEIKGVVADLQRLEPECAEDNLIALGMNFEAIFKEWDVTGDSTSRVVRIAEDVVHARNLFYVTTHVRAISGDESNYVSFVVRVGANRNKLVALTDEFIERVVDLEIDSRTTSSFVVRFSAVQDAKPINGNHAS